MDNVIEKYKNETNEALIKELGITFEEYKKLSPDQLKLIYFKQRLNTLKKHSKIEQNNQTDIILDNFRMETNEIIMETYGITFDEFSELSIPELVNLVRSNRRKNKQKIK